MLFYTACDRTTRHERQDFALACRCAGLPSGTGTHGNAARGQVGHIVPLCAGGSDTPENMQLLSIEEHKGKTRIDVRWCSAVEENRRQVITKEKNMKKLLLGITVLVVSFGIVGCAGTLPTNSYTPQNIVRVEGKSDIGNFTYQPYAEQKVKKPNQIQNKAIGSIYISSNVADYVKRGTALELEKSGIIIDDTTPYAIEGNVLEFMADDIGYSIHWTYAIQYTIKNKNDNKILFDKTFHPEMKKTGKFGLPTDYANIVAEIVLSGYELFIREPDVKKILESK